MMNEILGLYLGKFVQVYLDDIIIYYPCIESHYQHVKEVLKRIISRYSIKVCNFGVMWFRNSQVNPTKVDKITQWPAPAMDKKSTIVTSFARSLMK